MILIFFDVDGMDGGVGGMDGGGGSFCGVISDVIVFEVLWLGVEGGLEGLPPVVVNVWTDHIGSSAG